jgi:hypothetical protein
MLVKILDADPDFVESLKNQTRTNTASKAFVYAAERYESLNSTIEDLKRRIHLLELRHDVALSVIEGARSAAALLLDRTSQADLDV